MSVYPLSSLCLASLVLAMSASGADPAKTLRVVFSIAETSFDPQFASEFDTQ